MPYTKAISYSGKSLYKKCPRKWHRAYILGIRTPPHPKAERGTLLHDKLDKYFLGEQVYPAGDKCLAPWQSYMENLNRFSPASEAEVAVDSNWEPCAFDDPNAYFRGKKDLDIRTAIRKHIYDWKSGKVYPDHVLQGQAYVALDPEDFAQYTVRFAYLDIPRYVRAWHYTADDKKRFRDEITQEIEVIRMDETWDPNPGDECQWCELSWRRGGDCKAAP